MPKVKESEKLLYKKWIKGKEEVFVIELSSIRCVPCSLILKPYKKFQVDQHIGSSKHVQNCVSISFFYGRNSIS